IGSYWPIWLIKEELENIYNISTENTIFRDSITWQYFYDNRLCSYYGLHKGQRLELIPEY
ncbi:hypothetical protein GGF37_004244, partial [Kickxella alabastrina]